MTRAAARLWGPIALAVFVACVWVNQGLSEADWGPYHDRVAARPAAHPLDTARYPFVYLYKRASDVQLYYELANLMLGRPADTGFVTLERGPLPPRFTLPYPPADGRWHSPYSEILLEYPVAAVPVILAARVVSPDAHDHGIVFGVFMGLCLVGAVLVALDAAKAAGDGDDALRSKAWLASGLLLAQGAIAVQRLDATTALLIALAVRAAVLRRPLSFGAWMGLAAASKLVPVLMVPALLASDARTWRDARALSRFALGFAVALALGIGPMFLISGHALADVLAYHAARGLNCESTLGFLLAVWRLVTGTRVPSLLAFGSFDLQGSGADALAAVCGPLSVGAMLALGWLLWRGQPRDEAAAGRPVRVACAAFASLVVLWLTAKVFSTQYMTWGIPVVLAIPGRSGVRLAWLLLGAMALTQFYVVGHHELVMQGHPLGLLNLGARQALLAVAGYLAVRSLASERTTAEFKAAGVSPR
jgi:hypothetical protein